MKKYVPLIAGLFMATAVMISIYLMTAGHVPAVSVTLVPTVLAAFAASFHLTEAGPALVDLRALWLRIRGAAVVVGMCLPAFLVIVHAVLYHFGLWGSN